MARARRSRSARRRPAHPGRFGDFAVGVRPNIDLARAAGIEVNRGILVGDDMATSDPDIFAVGECIEHNGQIRPGRTDLGSGAVCWRGISPATRTVYGRRLVFTSLKISGVNVFSAGALAAAETPAKTIMLNDAKRGLYKKCDRATDRSSAACSSAMSPTVPGTWS